MNCGHFWYKRCMWSRCQPWVLYAWRLPCFPLASEKSGWSAVTTEPFADPRPMSQSPAPIRHFARSLRQLTKREPSVRYLMSQTQLPVLLTTNIFFFLLFETRQYQCSFIHDLLLPSHPFLCMFEVVEKAIIHTVLPVPALPSSSQCCLVLSIAQDQTHDLYSKPDSNKTSSWFCGRCVWCPRS